MKVLWILLFLSSLSSTLQATDHRDFPAYEIGQESTRKEGLTVNILTSINGWGLTADLVIIQEALQELGHSVRPIDILSEEHTTIPYADINLFIEMFDPNLFSFANVNWFIPNPEWYSDPISKLDDFDLILCRTREVERIFQQLGKPTYFLGFTSFDRYRDDIQIDFGQYGHFAGASFQKGTVPLLNVWLERADFPSLLMMTRYQEAMETPNLKIINWWVPHEEFAQLLNQTGVHLCLSETEGFGHSIMEAMSVGAVVVVVDAPPMNEFIQDPRCLVPYKATWQKWLATNYCFDEMALCESIQNLMNLPEEELAEIGQRNREFYLAKKKEFLENFSNLLKGIQ